MRRDELRNNQQWIGDSIDKLDILLAFIVLLIMHNSYYVGTVYFVIVFLKCT